MYTEVWRSSGLQQLECFMEEGFQDYFEGWVVFGTFLEREYFQVTGENVTKKIGYEMDQPDRRNSSDRVNPFLVFIQRVLQNPLWSLFFFLTCGAFKCTGAWVLPPEIIRSGVVLMQLHFSRQWRASYSFLSCKVREEVFLN